jgi:tetratricopeptide (TPR) repeat protein
VARLYETIPIELDEGATTFGDEFRKARALVESGSVEEGVSELVELAYALHHGGLYEVNREFVEDIRAAVAGRTVPPAQWAWLMNVEALVLSALNDAIGARRDWQEMERIGRELGDSHLVSTAEQNLALVALGEGDFDTAKALTRSAFEAKLELEDYYAATQLLLNLASTVTAAGDYARAREILGNVESLLDVMPDPGLRGSVYGQLGTIATQQGRHSEAEAAYRKALTWSRRSGDVSRELVGMQNGAASLADQWKQGQAIRWYRRAIALADRNQATHRLAVLRHSLGIALYRADRHRDAISELAASEQAAHDVGDLEEAAAAASDLGAVLTEQARYDDATVVLERSLDGFTMLGLSDLRHRVLRNIANASEAMGDTDGAIAALLAAVEALPTDSFSQRAETLRHAAQVMLRADRVTDAVQVLEQQVSLAGAAGPADVGWAAAQAAAMLSDAHHDETAVAFFTSSLDAYLSADDNQMPFHVRNDRAKALTRLDRYDEAEEDLQAALSIGARLNDRVMRQQALANLGETLRRAGRETDAIGHLREAVRLARRLADSKAEAHALGNLGVALVQAGRASQARRTYTDLMQVARKLKSRRLEAVALGGFGGVAFLEGDYATAVRRYRRAAQIEAEEDDPGQTESLGGLVESLSATGRRAGLENAVQALVDSAQRFGMEETAVVELFRSANQWLKRKRWDEAASLFAVAFLLGFAAEAGPEDAGEPAKEEPFEPSRAFIMPFVFLHQSLLDEVAESERNAFKAEVSRVLNETYEPGLGDEVTSFYDELFETPADPANAE